MQSKDAVLRDEADARDQGDCAKLQHVQPRFHDLLRQFCERCQDRGATCIVERMEASIRRDHGL